MRAWGCNIYPIRFGHYVFGCVEGSVEAKKNLDGNIELNPEVVRFIDMGNDHKSHWLSR